MKPTPQQIAKLPRWAQEHILDMERQRESAVTALNKFVDSQTVSAFSFEQQPCTGESSGPSRKTAYVQTDRIKAVHAGIELEIYCTRPNDSQRDYGIELTFRPVDRRHCNQVAVAPKSYGQIILLAKENLL